MTTPEHRPGAPDYAHQQSTFKEHTQAQAFIDNKKQYDARFHALAAAIGSFAWTTTIDCQGLDMLGWSTYTGLPLAECQGNGWRKALHPADNELLLQEWKKATKEHHVYNIACRIRRKDGHYSRCKVRTIPVFETDNEVTEWVWVANDLDEQPILEQDMLQKDATTQNSTGLLAAAFEAMNALFQMVKILVSSANLGVAGDSSPIDGDAVIRQVAIMVHKVLQLDFVGIATHLTEEENLQPRTVVGSSQAEEEQWWQTITHSKLSTYVDSSTVTKLQADKTCQLAPLWTSSNTGTQQRRLIVPLFAHGHFLGLIEVEYRESTLPEALDRQELLKAIGRLIALGIEQKNLLQERLEARANLLAL